MAAKATSKVRLLCMRRVCLACAGLGLGLLGLGLGLLGLGLGLELGLLINENTVCFLAVR